MTIRLTVSACAVAGALLAGPGHALTAPELWDDWRGGLTLLGQDVEVARQSYEGGVLRLEGVTQRMPIDPEVGRNITFIDALVLSEQPDGSVRIDIDGGYRIDFGGVADGDRSDGALSVTFEGLDAVARGEPGDLVYDFAASLAQLSLDELAYNGEPVPVAFQLAATEIASRTTQAETLYSGNGDVAALAMTLDASDDQGSRIALNYGLTDLTFRGAADYGELAAMGAGDPSAVFRSARPTELAMRHGPASFELTTSGPGGDGTVAGRAGSGSLDGRFGAGRALYGAGLQGLTMDISGAGVPFPLTLSSDELAFRVEGPMIAGDGPEPFSALLTMTGLTLPDTVWALFDPSGVLGREPAALELELSGLAQLDADLAGPVMGAQPPGQLRALALERLEISGAGAQASANGAFAFDPQGTPSMPGIPAASGRLNVEMRGIGALLTNLTSLGLLDPANAMGAQMMLGMFARPVPGGGDALTSEIEITPQGGITANGVRIR